VDSCMDCVRKHLGQAAALMDEAVLGYPTHRWRAVGHLAEAERESLPEYPGLAVSIREERLAYIADPDYRVPVDRLIREASENARVLSEKLSEQDSEE